MVKKSEFWLVAPYALWMVLMALLPATPAAYAIRTAATAAMLVAAACMPDVRKAIGRPGIAGLAIGVAAGLAVFAVWVLPEQFDWHWYRRLCILGESGTAAVAEADSSLLAVRLLGSAFVIAVAEELFFRKWLIGFAGFWWMVAMFAIEHDRWLVGALAGIVYGLVALRRGLLPAIAAHITTNLILGIWVLRTGQWQFW